MIVAKVKELKEILVKKGVKLEQGLTDEEFKFLSGLDQNSPFYFLYKEFSGMQKGYVDPRNMFHLYPLDHALKDTTIDHNNAIFKEFILFGSVMLDSCEMYISRSNPDDIFFCFDPYKIDPVHKIKRDFEQNLDALIAGGL